MKRFFFLSAFCTIALFCVSQSEPTFLQCKFSVILDTDAENVQDTQLYKAIEYWMGTRYRKGGFSKNGIDCSGLTRSLYALAYHKEIPRVSWLQYKASVRISSDSLKEGDLIFFRIGRTGHVGMYLQNNRFVHATCRSGVTVNSLNAYWKKYVYGYGKFE